MPSGVHNNHVGNRAPKAKCDCGSCKNCKHRAWKQRTGRVGGGQEVYGQQFESKVDIEPSFDDLTMRLIEKFERNGWD